MTTTARVSLAAVRRLCMDALVGRAGVSVRQAEAVADVVVAAERDGARSHGVFRLPGYVAAVLEGKVDPSAVPVVAACSGGGEEEQEEADGGATATVIVDGAGGFAPAAFRAGMPLLANKAKAHGVAAMAIRGASHFAALWFECEALAARDLASLVCVNSNAFVAVPGGSGRRLFGTNPMAFGWPRRGHLPPLVFDQASAAMARGEIQLLGADARLPHGVAVDRDGAPTRDPQEALLGAQLPFGTHKGTNIALMVELLAAGLTGGRFGFESHRDDPLWGGPTLNGQLVLALDPNAFTGVHGSRADMDNRVELLLERMLADGGRLPGSRRHLTRTGGEIDGDEANIEVEISTALCDEILSIVQGGHPTTQGYARQAESCNEL